MAKKGRYVYEWPRPMVTVDVVVFAISKGRAKVLLIKRGKEPFKGKWALPGGFVELDEELEDAAARELAEETSLRGVELEQLRTFGRCGRDPRGRQITVVFMGIVVGRVPRIRGGDDAAGARWFDVDRLCGDMAFDHDEIVRFAVARLKRRKAYRELVPGGKGAKRR